MYNNNNIYLVSCIKIKFKKVCIIGLLFCSSIFKILRTNLLFVRNSIFIDLNNVLLRNIHLNPHGVIQNSKTTEKLKK